MIVMRSLIITGLFIFSILRASAEVPQPTIKEGVWHVPFRYWSSLSPVLEGTGGFNFLCEVAELGEEPPPQKKGPFRYQKGLLNVVEVLHADTKKFPSIKDLKKLSVEGCRGLKVGDRVIVFVNSEPYEGGYVIDHHQGTNCQIGHRLTKSSDKDHDPERNKILLNVVRRNISPIFKLTSSELRALKHMDSGGLLEALIREVEIAEMTREFSKAK